MELNKTYNEDCLETMARMPDGYVDCVVCSPPYWGLRAYKCEPKIWDGSSDCEHEWGSEMSERKRGALQGKNASVGNQVNGDKTGANFVHLAQGNFCAQCGAWKGTIGNEPSFELYIVHLLQIFAEVKRVLKKTGTLWVNLGDSYGTVSGRITQLSKGVPKEETRYNSTVTLASSVEGGIPQNKNIGLHKHLLQIPSRFAIGMTDKLGFILRNRLIWRKPNCMPSSAKDRFTVDYEDVFFFVKAKKYYFEGIREGKDRYRTIAKSGGQRFAGDSYPGRRAVRENREIVTIGKNKRTVWDVNTEPSFTKHCATYPVALVKPMIKAGCPEGGIVYDPFIGTGTTAIAALELGRKFIGSEISEEYCKTANIRTKYFAREVNLF